MVDGIKKILEFRAESFQQLLLPPRRKEFDGVIEPLQYEWLYRETETVTKNGAGNCGRIAFNKLTAGRLNGQATKGSRRIPWHTEAMKDVVTCDKSRGAGNTL